MSTNNKISNLINSQVPFFVRNDHQTFVRFLEAYYEYLEQDGKAVDRAKNLLSYQDIDTSVDQFTQELYNTFLKGIPEDIVADKNLLLKHIKDFYRARGTEKALRFLLNIVYGEQDVEFYYPKKDVLKVSDGKWYIQKSLRVSETSIDGTSNNSLFGLEKFIGLSVRGNTSGAVAAVERVDRFFEQGTQVDEIILTSIRGNFRNGETVFATFSEEGVNKSITSNVFGGILNVVTLTNPGSGYQVGQHPTIVNSTGTGGDIIIEEVSTGNVQSIIVVEGGSGYRVSDSVLITGGGGSGANANVFVVLDDSSVHPNTYNIVISLISSEANTNISNAIYSNLSNANANTTLANALSTFVYSNTGPTRTVLVINKGDNYSSVPSLSVVANTRIRELGILGSMSIIDGGTGYANNDKIEFINVVGGYGSGGQANVVSVNGTGSIKTVKFIPVDGQITGGSGYSELFLPRANVITSTGTGANIAVTSILGTGAVLTSSNSTIGAIQRLGILSRGLNYSGTANVDFTDLGDGLATADVSILEGTYSYPGYYLNDDGHISGYNFLQDRDYYQNFSYVVKVKTSLERYRKVVKELLHPAGMKMFGQYTVVDESENISYSSDVDTAVIVSTPIPTLDLDFTTGVLDANVTFSRTSSATYVGSDGLIKTASANTPRFEYSLTNRQPKGLLIEEARTNLYTYSEQFNNGTWGKNASVIVPNTSTAPDGTLTADKLNETAVTNYFAITRNPTAIANTTYTWSCYVKAAERKHFAINFSVVTGGSMVFDLINKVGLNVGAGITSHSVTQVSEDWYRCVATFKTAASGSNLLYHVMGPTTVSGGSYLGTAGSGVYIWGAQLEIGAFATSYIPTAASAVTRSLDAASITGTNFSNFYNQSEGTVSVTYSTKNVTGVVLTADGGSYVQRSVQINLFAALNQAATYTVANSVITSTIIVSAPQSLEYTVGYAYKANNFAGVMNGGIVGVDNSGVVASNVIAMRLGSFFDNSYKLNGTIKYLKYYNKRLANTVLQQITTKP